MIRIILTLCLFFIGANAYSQAPLIIRNDGKTTALDSNLFVGKSFRPPAFNDTTQANQSIKVLDSSGRIIFTRDSSTLWVRNVGKYWQKLVSGSGVITLQQAFNADPTANPDINAGNNTFLIAGDNNSGGVSRLIVGNNQGAQLYSKLDNIGYVNAKADGTVEISSSLAGSNSQKLVMNESKSYLVSGGNTGSDTSLTKLGIGTLYPEAPLDVSGAPRFRTDSAQAGYVWTSKDTNGQGEWRVVSTADSSTYFTNYRADTMRSNLYANKVPYTGATQDVDLGAFKLNAQSVHIKGTAGAGHLGLKHQSAAATASGQETSIYADNNGDVAWKNDNLYITTLKTSGNTADRIYTFPDSSGTVALLSNVNAKQDTLTAWKTSGNFGVNAGQFIGSRNNSSLRFRTNNTENMVLDSTGNLNINANLAGVGTDKDSYRLNLNAIGSSSNAQQGYIAYDGNGGSNGGSLQIGNSNGSISLIPSSNDINLSATSPQIYTTTGGPRFTNNSTSTGFIFGNYNTQSSGSLFSVKNTYTDPTERNPFTIFSNGNVKMGQIGLSTIDSGYAVDMTGNAVRISNTAGLSTPNSTALLDLTSTNRGMLIPRMTTTQRNAISTPATGLSLYNTNDSTHQYYTGSIWRGIGSYLRADGLATTVTDNTGLVLENATLATAGVTNQYSPSISFKGNGWNSGGTPASRPTSWRIYSKSGSGSTVAGTLAFDYSNNNAAYTQIMELQSNGNVVSFASNISGTGSVSNFANYSSSGGSTSSAVDVYSSLRGFNPTSGTAVFNAFNATPTINQTGGANGISRGLYVNPTLTSAADWRAIETTNGQLRMSDTYAAGSGSLAGGLMNLSQTWNTTGNPTAFFLNVTNTASGANARVFDIQLGGSSQLTIDRSGNFSGSQAYRNTASSTLGALTVVNPFNAGPILELRYGTTGYNGTSGTVHGLQVTQGLNVASGTTVFNAMAFTGGITQGTGTGITRGLLIQPTLTSAADWRAIETTNGQLRMSDTYAAGSGSRSGSLLDLSQTWNTTGTPTAIRLNVTNTASGSTASLIDLQVGGTSYFTVDKGAKITQFATNTAAGTTGNQTINRPTGTVNIAAAGTTVTVTNNLVTANSLVFAVIRTNDATATIKNVVPGAGTFTINLNAATTAETSIGFWVIN